MAAKEFLSNSGLEFSSINLNVTPGAQERLRALGYRSAMVCKDGVCVSVVELQPVADLLGIPYEHKVELPPHELYERFLMALDASCRYLMQCPDHRLTHYQPDRPERTFRALIIHIMQIALAFVNGQRTGRLALRGVTIARVADPGWPKEKVLEFAAVCREELKNWWETTGYRVPMESQITDNWGVHTLHQTLERQTWHAVQHTRQVEMFLEQLEIEPDGLLTEKDLAGLPLPENIWAD